LSKTGYEEEASPAIFFFKKKQMADYDLYAFNIKKSIGLVDDMLKFLMELLMEILSAILKSIKI
jgi:hypothetical protein